MTRLFIYGTLKRGGSNHACMAGQRFIAEVATAPHYRMYDLGGYPGLVPVADGDGLSIRGELWDVDDECKVRLDALEGVEIGEYALAAVPLLEPHEAEQAQVYLYLRSVDCCPEVGSEWRQ